MQISVYLLCMCFLEFLVAILSPSVEMKLALKIRDCSFLL